ncbi:hypothetical protein ACVILJ_001303 [Bradyrhizobium diazoefficiens]
MILGSAATVRALDVVQQQDALALGLQPLDRELVDTVGRHVPPVVGGEIGAPDLDAARDQIVLDALGAHQAGNAEERCELGRIGHRGRGPFDAAVDLGLEFFDSHPVERQRMVHAVRADGVARRDKLAHPFRIRLGLAADDEEGRLDALVGEDLEHLVGIFRQRTVVEGQDDLVILQRQRLAVLHRADARMLVRIDHEGAGGPERVRVAGTVGCKGRRCSNGQQAQTKDDPRSRPNNNATSDHESRLPHTRLSP